MINLKIVIPTYNRFENLSKLILSIEKQQINPNLHVSITIYDNSDVNYISNFLITSEFKIPIDYIRNKKNIGLIENLKQCYFNNKSLSSTFIWVLGDDDVLITDDILNIIFDYLKSNQNYYYLLYSNVNNDYKLVQSPSKIYNCYNNPASFIENELINCGWIGANIFNSSCFDELPKKIENEYFPHISIIIDCILKNKIKGIEFIDLRNKLANRWENKDTTTWSKNYIQCVLSYCRICIYFSAKTSNKNMQNSLLISSNEFIKKMSIEKPIDIFKFYKSNLPFNINDSYIYVYMFGLTRIFYPIIFNIIIYLLMLKNRFNKL